MEILANRQLKLFSRAGESKDDFATRCHEAAAAKADEEGAKLRDKYEAKVRTIQGQLQTAEDRRDVLQAEAKGREHEELLSTAGSILGGFLGGRSRLSTELRRAASGRSRSKTAGARLDAAENKLDALQAQLADLEAELSDDVLRISSEWDERAAAIDAVPVSLEKSDVQVTQLVLAWIPVT
jgi:hypothetical protein